MLTVTLQAKIYSGSQLGLADKLLRDSLKGLRVESRVCEASPRGWVQVNLSGEDEKAASRFLADNFGLCPVQFDSVSKFSRVNGRVVRLDEKANNMLVDVGVVQPNPIDASVSLDCLQAHLADGRKVALKRLGDLFGFCENLPIALEVLDVRENYIEAVLSGKQIEVYRRWVESLLDRLIILGTPLYYVKAVLREAGFERDVVDVEALGLFECVVVCKLGTEAAGLIPRIGKSLRRSVFSVFSPRRIIDFLGDDWVKFTF